MESGFDYLLIGSSWCIQCSWKNVTSPSLGLGHMMVVHCVSHLAFMPFGSAQEEYHGGDLHIVRYDSSGTYTCTLFWFNYFNVSILLIPNFACVCRCRKVMRSIVASSLLDTRVCNHGHCNPVSKSILATSPPSWADCASICCSVVVLCYGFQRGV